MNIQTALRKINILSKGELLHCIQLINTEIEHYKRVIRNYTPYKMERYGMPYLVKLKKQKKQFEDRYDRMEKKMS